MKRTIIITLLTLALATVFSACERNDYQHPGYRSGQHK
jgi:predicted small secreted protein